MAMKDEFQAGILECLPHLRRFANLLARNHALAEDLVQETVLRALTYRHQFKPGTNLRGWLIVILRNRFFNEVRRSSRRLSSSMEGQSFDVPVSGGQEEKLQLSDVQSYFAHLPERQQEALMLVGIDGYSYDEAARIADCAVGTMKSRVCRARMELGQFMQGERRADLSARRRNVEGRAQRGRPANLPTSH